MSKHNKHHIALTAFLFAVIIVGIILLQMRQNFERQIAHAEIKTGTERTANAYSTVSRQTESDVAVADNGSYVITWTSENQTSAGDPGDVFFRRFDSNGDPIDTTDQLVNTATAGTQKNPKIAMDSLGNFVIAWVDGDSATNNWNIYIRAYRANGIPNDLPLQVNSDTAHNQASLADIAMEYNNVSTEAKFVVTWHQNNGTSDDIYMQRYIVNNVLHNQPAAEGSITTVNSYRDGEQLAPTVAMNTDGRFIIVWYGIGDATAENHIWYQIYTFDGNHIGDNIRADSYMISSAQNPAATVAKGDVYGSKNRFLLAYDGISTDESDRGIFARSITCQNDNSSCSLDPVEVRVNTTILNTQSNVSIDADYFGNFTATWFDAGSDGVNCDDDIIRGQSYKFGTLARLGSEYTVSTGGYCHSEVSTGMNNDGQYVNSFDYSPDEAGNPVLKDIHYQQFVSDLFKAGKETILHEADSSKNQHSTDVAVAPNGNIAAVYVDQYVHGIFVTLYNTQGITPTYTNVRVDSNDASNIDANPSISFFKDTSGDGEGRFVVAWEGVSPSCATTSGDGLDILYREVSPSGIPVGGCEILANTNVTGDQTSPDIAAGQYMTTDIPPVTIDRFAIVYKDEDTKVESAYHDLDAFTYNTIDDTCTTLLCLKPKVAFSMPDSQIYVWENSDSESTGIYARPASGALPGNPRLINEVANGGQSSPDVTFTTPEYFVISYTDNASSPASIIWNRSLMTFPDSTSVNSGNVNDGEIGTGEVYSRITGSDNSFLVTWTDFPGALEDNQIFGRFFEFQPNGSYGDYVPFDHSFRINSTQAGSQTLPSAGMNSMGEVVVGWEGNYSGDSGMDANAAIWQRLTNPLYAESFPRLQPSAQQTIEGGEKTLTVPASISFGTASVNAQSNTTESMAIRDVTDPINYIEISDLDGAAFNLSVVINDDFLLTPPGTTSYIPKANASIKNWDGNTTDTNAGCNPSAPLFCFLTLNTASAPTSFALNSDTENYAALDQQRILVSKTNDHEIGKWRIYPQLRLNIPARTPPGTHTTTITFSLI
jgi:hypothetical protein